MPVSYTHLKKDRKSNKAIAGAVYGVYSDKDGKNLITKMPEIGRAHV